MSESKLRFVTEPYHLGYIENYVLHFREQGYVVLPDVFERESVNEYLAQIQAALVPGKSGRMELPPSPLRIAPTRAPRIRQVVKSAFSTGAMVPNVSLFEVAWAIAAAEAPGSIAGHWHKDRDHRCVSCAHGYCPGDIHVGMYFTDMTPAHGPTQVIARSHRDINRTPFGGCEPDSFLCRKQDAVMWDQRLWHRATPRTAEGHRVFGFFGFYPIPNCDTKAYPMDLSQRQAWLEAHDDVEAMLYGGLFAQRREVINRDYVVKGASSTANATR